MKSAVENEGKSLCIFNTTLLLHKFFTVNFFSVNLNLSISKMGKEEGPIRVLPSHQTNISVVTKRDTYNISVSVAVKITQFQV